MPVKNIANPIGWRRCVVGAGNLLRLFWRKESTQDDPGRVKADQPPEPKTDNDPYLLAPESANSAIIALSLVQRAACISSSAETGVIV